METINNVVNSASKAIWGDQSAATGNETGSKEPVSGVQGAGTASHPYDQGNAATPNEPAAKTDPFNTAATTKTETELPIRTTTNIKSDEVSKPQIPLNPTSAVTGGEPKPLESTEGTGVTGSSAQKLAPKGGDVVPSESSSNPGAAPASGAAPAQKQQGADRPLEAPADKEEDPETILKKRDPNDHSGEPLHVHGDSEKSVSVPATQEERRESKDGLPGGQEHGKEPKGTGDIWEKSTGLQADGGDFDATKPGAGKEADRLLEDKGVHHDDKSNKASSPKASSPPATAGGADKDKVSKMDKFKDKLHIGHHKDDHKDK
ncbi:hypothetical protein P280DRAFT_466469 [Massarina eburnea CBS 473.64]|uniref:Glycine-rich cell wall structural protein 1 n=1 Tax=Massarina eburnea CBS 473.64 TaxID=1395130 RepID=A0A6A6S7L0_9PLEO|nr:hypothetical protein P280DRAFT_466469 [Massarina eburnea CBS 473.64]